MDADLVSPPGKELAGDQLLLAVAAGEQFLEEGGGLFAVGDVPHLQAVRGAAADRLIDQGEILLQRGRDDGEVVAPHALVLKLLREGLVGLVVLGDDHQAAGPLVEAVDNAVALFAADGGEADPLVLEPVDEGRLLDAGGGVDRDAAGLVEDEQVVIFVDDRHVEIDLQRRTLLRFGEGDVYRLAPFELEARFGNGFAVDRHGSLLDELCDLVAGNADAVGQEGVEALGGVDGKGCRVHSVGAFMLQSHRNFTGESIRCSVLTGAF